MEVFVARQPIFNKQLQVYGYELLFRSGTANYYDALDGDRATSDVITSTFSVIGFNVLTGGKRAFINFTANLLKKDIATILPKELVAIEILEAVEPEEDIIAACRRLKRLGYLIVLDDFVMADRMKPFVELADIIKVDFLATKPEQREAIVQKLGNHRIKFLAEKVETNEEFENAVQLGYSYFQGYFFSRPVIYSGRDIPENKLNLLRLLQEVNQPDLDLNHLEQLIKHDVSLSYKLLRLMNSAAFGFNSRIKSIKYAIALLGIVELKKWVSMLALRAMGNDKPDELVINSLIRARFAELLAPIAGMKDRSTDLFLMGMFSRIDALLDQPLNVVLAELPISSEIKDGLLGVNGKFKAVYDLIRMYEDGDIQQLRANTEQLQMDIKEIPQLYLRALDWVSQIQRS